MSRCACGIRHERPQYQAWPAEPEERITPLRLLGLVLFALGMWAVLLYALPVVLIGLFA